jgi:hypothetical protein
MSPETKVDAVIEMLAELVRLQAPNRVLHEIGVWLATLSDESEAQDG